MKPNYSDMGCLYLHKMAETTRDHFGLSFHLSLINQTFVVFLVIGWANYFEMDCLKPHMVAEGTPDCSALSCHLSLMNRTLAAIPVLDLPKDSAAAGIPKARDLMICLFISQSGVFRFSDTITLPDQCNGTPPAH